MQSMFWRHSSFTQIPLKHLEPFTITDTAKGQIDDQNKYQNEQNETTHVNKQTTAPKSNSKYVRFARDLRFGSQREPMRDYICILIFTSKAMSRV